MRTLPLDKAFQLIEPGPVVWVTTAHKGRMNVMTMTWHMVVDFTPRLACIIGPWDFTFTALKKTRECVIAIPTADMADTAVEIGNCSGREVDKFERFGLTPRPAKRVGAPLIAECLAHIECRVADTRLVNGYGLWVLEGVHAWIEPAHRERRTLHAQGDGRFAVDGPMIDLRRKMKKL
ncbi:flavin reductase family protein [Betaproteobacteria bacterium SCN1]|jgi:flavin reductase (DIM6/NTAB) family NADH-FMN oxidoreductase RutF|nr:flavin reductase family protein [Betaproteobacteria bacterium SCN1]MBN8759615.1 flavin reductase family protein [Thiobacillus sp.]ODU89676.1 MAG: flavin reductase [Thiobacillus sp. SCN 65-179]OJW37604.1 MAG: flavin reductase [Thiobacillus sp. 65-69]